MYKLRGFTLIDLLIVVAIIAILAAIAVPNFLEAQVRSKVSRARNDLRTMALALESYRTDSNQYPPDGWIASSGTPTLWRLTSPVVYMTSLPKDTFQNLQKGIGNTSTQFDYTYSAQVMTYDDGKPTCVPRIQEPKGRRLLGQWILVSVGPDKRHDSGEWAIWGPDALAEAGTTAAANAQGVYSGAIYDPTNGTVSKGDIVRMGP
jgi:type II secretion system protein G